MANGFHSLTMRGSDLAERLPAVMNLRFDAEVALTNEHAARRYLDLALQTVVHDRPVFLGIVAPDVPARVPALVLTDELPSPFGDHILVRFRQHHRRVPVFGSIVTTELDRQQRLGRLELNIADVEDLDGPNSRPPELSPRTAVEKLAASLGVGDLDAAVTTLPQLVLYPGGKSFVQCWLVADFLTPDKDNNVMGEWGASLGGHRFSDCFVDATSGEIVAVVPATSAFDVPVRCSGDDEVGVSRDFDGRHSGADYEMNDPVRSVRTYDVRFAPYDIVTPPGLGNPVANQSPTWGGGNPAAVTAHANVTIVYDFFEQTCHRQGVDGKQTPLESVVNCADALGNTAWPAAVFTRGDNRMVYGQDDDGHGHRVSWARHLDITAHELTHGVTKYTAGLLTRDESGALNESMSDIFAISVVNLSANRVDPASWTWELGPGLAAGGGPIRDMSDPARGTPSQPDHMSNYMSTSLDFGGVHTNSGIHNRAAYRVFTAQLKSGALALPPDDVVRVYYYVLANLTANALFSDARAKFIDVVQNQFVASPDLAEMVTQFEAAYDSVGIT